MAKTPSRNRTRGRTGGGAGLAFVPGVTTVTLSNASISENAAQGAAVGTLLTVPSVATLTLVDSAGGRFALNGPNLVRGATALDFEAAAFHDITIRAERGIVVNEVTLRVNVTNVAEITNIALSTPTIVEGAASGTVVGSLTSTPAGATFALTNTDGGRFALVGTQIRAGATAIAGVADRSITVRGTRQGETFDKAITITVTPAA